MVSKKRKPAIFAGGLCALASLFVRHFKGKKRHTNLHAKRVRRKHTSALTSESQREEEEEESKTTTDKAPIIMDENDGRSSQKKDYYAVLNLPRDCTTEDVKRKYKLLAQKVHPDKALSNNNNAAKKSFALIHEAYQILHDAGETESVRHLRPRGGGRVDAEQGNHELTRNGKRRRKCERNSSISNRQKARERAERKHQQSSGYEFKFSFAHRR